MLNRRSLITELISFVAAPAIVRASNLMPIKTMNTYPLSEQEIAKIINKITPYIGVDFVNLDMSAFYISHLDGGKVKVRSIPQKEFYKILDNMDDNARTNG